MPTRSFPLSRKFSKIRIVTSRAAVESPSGQNREQHQPGRAGSVDHQSPRLVGLAVKPLSLLLPLPPRRLQGFNDPGLFPRRPPHSALLGFVVDQISSRDLSPPPILIQPSGRLPPLGTVPTIRATPTPFPGSHYPPCHSLRHPLQPQTPGARFRTLLPSDYIWCMTS